MVSNASYLICIFINFNETLKMTEKSLKSINKLILGPNDDIKPVISFDKFINVMGLNENYLICIFMNINKNVENRGKKQGETIPTARFLMGNMICLVSLKPILMAASVVRGTTLMS